ncbi:hypothetical protein Leryth_011306 [Lithospermum erythrorhizon]|nr:hypothetical protein Leryth_011306 [Lithospermum erythrorhizon]
MLISGNKNVKPDLKDEKSANSIEQLREADYVFLCDLYGQSSISDVSGSSKGLTPKRVDDKYGRSGIIRNLPKMELLDDPKSKAKEKFVSSVHTVTNAEKHLKQSEDSEGRPIKRGRFRVVENLIETNQISLVKANVAPKDSSQTSTCTFKKIKTIRNRHCSSNITTKLIE